MQIYKYLWLPFSVPQDPLVGGSEVSGSWGKAHLVFWGITFRFFSQGLYGLIFYQQHTWLLFILPSLPTIATFLFVCLFVCVIVAGFIVALTLLLSHQTTFTKWGSQWSLTSFSAWKRHSCSPLTVNISYHVLCLHLSFRLALSHSLIALHMGTLYPCPLSQRAAVQPDKGVEDKRWRTVEWESGPWWNKPGLWPQIWQIPPPANLWSWLWQPLIGS